MQTQFGETSQQSEDVKQRTSPPGQGVVDEEMAALRAELDGLRGGVAETEAALETHVLRLEQYTLEQTEFTRWLEAAENKVKTHADPTLHESSEEQLMQLEVRVTQEMGVAPTTVETGNLTLVLGISGDDAGDRAEAGERGGAEHQVRGGDAQVVGPAGVVRHAAARDALPDAAGRRQGTSRQFVTWGDSFAMKFNHTTCRLL